MLESKREKNRLYERYRRNRHETRKSRHSNNRHCCCPNLGHVTVALVARGVLASEPASDPAPTLTPASVVESTTESTPVARSHG